MLAQILKVSFEKHLTSGWQPQLSVTKIVTLRYCISYLVIFHLPVGWGYAKSVFQLHALIKHDRYLAQCGCLTVTPLSSLARQISQWGHYRWDSIAVEWFLSRWKCLDTAKTHNDIQPASFGYCFELMGYWTLQEWCPIWLQLTCSLLNTEAGRLTTGMSGSRVFSASIAA